MALIDCPECGAKVSDKAPTCPHCGVVIAGTSDARPAETKTQASALVAESASAQPDYDPNPPPLATERSAEPFRIAGRRVPIAALLFWGGMVIGVILSMTVPNYREMSLRYLPYLMIFTGMLWFSVTEFTMLIRNRVRRSR
jgi:hypothetical protein